MTYDHKMSARVLRKFYVEGKSWDKIREELIVSKGYIRDVVRRWQQDGSLQAIGNVGTLHADRVFNDTAKSMLFALIAEDDARTQHEYAHDIAELTGRYVSACDVGKAMQQLSIGKQQMVALYSKCTAGTANGRSAKPTAEHVPTRHAQHEQMYVGVRAWQWAVVRAIVCQQTRVPAASGAAGQLSRVQTNQAVGRQVRTRLVMLHRHRFATLCRESCSPGHRRWPCPVLGPCLTHLLTALVAQPVGSRSRFSYDDSPGWKHLTLDRGVHRTHRHRFLVGTRWPALAQLGSARPANTRTR